MATSPTAAPRLRRTWPQRMVLTVNVVAIAGALFAASTMGYSNNKLAGVKRIELKGILREDQQTAPGAPLNYLLVGSDDASGLPPGSPELSGRGEVAGKRTDTIMVLRVDPKDTTARLLSFPRDLWVDIPGTGTKSRINSAFESGGALRLIQTISQDFGIPIDHYVEVDLAAFKKLVDAIGGVPMYFPEPARSAHSTTFNVTSGCQTLDGTQALAFVRIRKDYQTYRDGRWELDPSGDFGRINRQQYFIQTALQRAKDKGIRNPVTLRKLVDLAVSAVNIDDSLKIDDVITLGNRFRNFNPENLIKYSVPADDAVHGGAQVLEVRQDEADPILSIFRGSSEPAANDTDTPIQPSQVRVQVLNGSRVGGQARDVTNALARAGFASVSPNDSDAALDQTTLRYAPGRAAYARLLARYVDGPVQFEASDAVSGIDVQLVTGADFTTIRSQPKADADVPAISTTSTTSTTQPSTTTTTTTLVGEVPKPPPGVSCS